MLNIFRTVTVPIVSRSSCVAVRTYRRSGNRKPRDQAGLRIQQGILNDWKALEQDPELTYDADFMQVGQSYREHEQEMASKKEQLKYYVIRSKYFKTKKQPNFLTWAEKEQIRHLNKEDSDEWTPEKLAESFPAVEEVIIKVLKANWTPSDMKRIQKHDENVRKNWELFKSGEIKDLDSDVVDHLKKFSNRNFDSIKNSYVQTNNDQIKFKFPQPKSKEFLQIVSSCKKTNTNKAIDDSSKPQFEGKPKLLVNQSIDDVQLKLPKQHSTRKMTYDQLTKSIRSSNTDGNDEMHLSVSLPKGETSIKSDGKSADVTEESTPNDSKEIDNIQESQENNVINLTAADLSSSKKVQKFAVKTSSLANVSQDVVPAIQHKINIPPRLRKKYAVYRLYDCFYDDNGGFMYRVPGLSN